MQKLKSRAGLAVCALVLMSFLGCSTVTIRPKGIAKASSDPTYEEMKSYFLFGLIGEHTIDVTKVCGGKDPVQMQSQDTFLDSFLTIITIGIYTPRHAKVWCS